MRGFRKGGESPIEGRWWRARFHKAWLHHLVGFGGEDAKLLYGEDKVAGTGSHVESSKNQESKEEQPNTNPEPRNKERIADWGDLSVENQSQLADLCSAAPTIVRILKKLQQSHQDGYLEYLSDDQRFINIGDPGEDAQPQSIC